MTEVLIGTVISLFICVAMTYKFAFTKGYDMGYDDAKKECNDDIDNLKELFKK